jgi:hypothetical protein
VRFTIAARIQLGEIQAMLLETTVIGASLLKREVV